LGSVIDIVMNDACNKGEDMLLFLIHAKQIKRRRVENTFLLDASLFQE
jgi:hypothetical protein